MTIVESIRSFVCMIGEFVLFTGEMLKKLGKLWHRKGLFLRHCEFIGVASSGIVGVAAIFMGGVLGYQLYVSFKLFGAEALLGGSVGVGLFRELGPVMASIMVCGRAGAAIAAELASMKISEQVDALEVMAVNPYEYLVTPRVVAGTLMMPLLSVFFVIVGTLAAAGVACGIMNLQSSIFWAQYAKMVDRIDIIHCIVKSLVFGFVLSLVACFCGFRASGGARGVGLATRSTVVATCLTILLSDYVLTALLPFGFAKLKVN